MTCCTAGPPASAQRSAALPEDCRYFSYRELEEATQGWARSAVIGDGGFGRVYKGRLRSGEQIAAKRLDRHGMQVLPPTLPIGPILVHLTIISCQYAICIQRYLRTS